MVTYVMMLLYLAALIAIGFINYRQARHTARKLVDLVDRYGTE